MARVGLGRAGNSLPTRELLDFQLAHARARDAVHYPFDADGLAREIGSAGWPAVIVNTVARDRAEYLRHPGLGRQLDARSKALLDRSDRGWDAVFIVADG